MIALNHVVFATIIAVSVKQPALIAPLALGSHFVLDSLPHFDNGLRWGVYSRAYYRVILADTIATAIAYFVAISFFPTVSTAILIAAIFAVLPDLFWPLAPRTDPRSPLGRFFHWHKRIQRYELAHGWYWEFIWLGLFILTLVGITQF